MNAEQVPDPRSGSEDEACERFIARQGPLARALAALPGFSPPPTAEARFRAWLANREQVAGEQQRHARLQFAPSADGQARLRQQFERLQRDQLPRRNALLQQIRQAADALTDDTAALTPAARRWLQTQASMPPHAPPPPRRHALPGWLGLAFSFVLVAAVALPLLLGKPPWPAADPMPPATEAPLSRQHAAAPAPPLPSGSAPTPDAARFASAADRALPAAEAPSPARSPLAARSAEHTNEAGPTAIAAAPPAPQRAKALPSPTALEIGLDDEAALAQWLLQAPAPQHIGVHPDELAVLQARLAAALKAGAAPRRPAPVLEADPARPRGTLRLSPR